MHAIVQRKLMLQPIIAKLNVAKLHTVNNMKDAQSLSSLNIKLKFRCHIDQELEVAGTQDILQNSKHTLGQMYCSL